MSTAWTKEQAQAIDVRERNVLVSAAAGSGKTAVLVERILSMVTDSIHPVDIDRLLIVTFTRAAAAEMRARIGAGLEKLLAETPDDEHLQRQSILLHHAQISTIHSFCTYVIQNYFHRIGLDPVYRIAEEGELHLLRSEVIEELMEEEYRRAAGEGNEDFLLLAETLAPGRNDKAVEDAIRKVADYALSDPDPKGWLHKSIGLISATNEAELENSAWMQGISGDVKRRVEGLIETTKRNLQRANSPKGPASYIPALEDDLQKLEELYACEGYQQMQAFLAELNPKRLGGRPSDEESPELRQLVKDVRDSVKKALDDIRKSYFAVPPQEILRQLELARPVTAELVRLAGAYLDKFAEAKQEKNICDFSDLEHNALAILLTKTDDGWERTEAAKELSLQFDEILIDEYQDSNALQDIILEAVSREKDNAPNRFMVGDIKQSIYGFRMARPELFLEKYDRYGTEGEREQRIDLAKNFRSRKEVLDIVNAVFGELMTGTLGGLVYDDASKLYLGAAYPEREEKVSMEAELLLVGEPAPEFARETNKNAMEQTEALAIATRIRELVRTAEVYDKDAKMYRPARYSDCVVLLRAASDNYVRVLQEAGVPAHADSREGYFSAYEVATVLNLLRVCDNPRQDIPLAAVLRSPIAGLSDEELAILRASHRDLPLYEAAVAHAEKNEKLAAFLARLEVFRELSARLPVHELILHILEETGFRLIAASMPGGEQREANLKMLVEQAVTFESTSYHGLFRFIRYIEDLGKYKVDFGEVNIFGEAENAVRVMTVHKSKGLEFPFVFVANLGKQFNTSDRNQSIVMHAGMGFALDAVDLESRVRWTPMPKTVIRQKIRLDALAEELRVLYVAMTRAREKLILTASSAAMEKELAQAERGIDYESLTGAKSFLQWILPAIRGGAPIRVEHVDSGLLHLFAEGEELRRASARERIDDPNRPGDSELAELLSEQAAFRYPYAYLADMPAKMTVSELKRASLAALAEETGQELIEERPVVPYLPKFIKGEEEAGGAARGTIYHRVWECIDYAAEVSEEAIAAQIAEMVEKGKLAKEDAEVVKSKDILVFLEGELGCRMREAAKDGRLRREQPFVFRIPAREIDPAYPEEETILIQGVIDAYFEEDGKYILVDYKTDHTADPTGDELVAKYRTQLATYARALSQITGREVAETYIYSMSLKKEIRYDQ